MPSRPPVYGRVTFTSHRFAEFRAEIDAARREALLEAGRVGRDEARSRYHHRYAGGPAPSTKTTISFRTDAKHILQITVGTLRGVFKEYGTKERSGGRGRQEADPYLRPGALAALRTIIPNMRRLGPGLRSRL